MSPASVEAYPSHESLTRIEWLTFSGKPDEDVFLFIQAVTQFALSLDRERDSDWMATYTYGCLKDEALKWYETLDPKIRGKWLDLRKLLIAKFGTPAPVKTFHARIKVIRANGAEIGYVGYIDSSENSKIVESATEALVLEMPFKPPEQGLNLIYVVRPGVDNASFPFVGIEITQGSSRYPIVLVLRAVDGYKPLAIPFPDTGKPASGNVWSLKRNDDGTEELTTQWSEDEQTPQPLTFLSRTPLLDDPKSDKIFWMRRVGDLDPTNEVLRLVLERF